MARPLTDLLAALPTYQVCCAPQGLEGIEIAAITADSRQATPGSLFVAVRGATVNGHRFIPSAVERGAVAVVGAEALSDLAVPYVRVPDERAALAALAAALYGFPSRQLRVVGVTGTDGKTTTCNLIYVILSAAGQQPGMISTVSARIGDQELDTGLHVTTPDAVDVQRYLAQMAAAGCQTAVLEATSHGLHQGRVAAVDFDVAVVTNVTHEHLDYHGTWEAYLEAKALLFRSLADAARKPGQPKVAVLNADDASYGRLSAISADRRLSYSLQDPAADLYADEIEMGADGIRFVAHTPAGPLPLFTPLVGRFNVYNCLAALGAGLALGASPEAIAQGIAAMRGVEGRMERIAVDGQDFLAIVDFAHTPQSLASALEAARSLSSGRLIVVFGSAGLRDREKRRLMPRIAGQHADRTILTAEDPRTEPLEAILATMAEAAREVGGQEGRDFLVIPDRTAAIQAAVEAAEPGDVVMVCGKGHERSMCFGEVEHPWRDQDV
ncbi:MAG: UDP-N-acetylmuramoyl-L-alanyl-D-glutamate--2,6-diaminopimelate ligase, partial [Caldilineales bacterium]|nr:UDP-N-acetylmuramoyl-L-alanyl-D-glutamate--2,6-diaminopimelate ligase [Caldilineales bacterium]